MDTLLEIHHCSIICQYGSDGIPFRLWVSSNWPQLPHHLHDTSHLLTAVSTIYIINVPFGTLYPRCTLVIICISFYLDYEKSKKRIFSSSRNFFLFKKLETFQETDSPIRESDSPIWETDLPIRESLVNDWAFRFCICALLYHTSSASI